MDGLSQDDARRSSPSPPGTPPAPPDDSPISSAQGITNPLERFLARNPLNAPALQVVPTPTRLVAPELVIQTGLFGVQALHEQIGQLCPRFARQAHCKLG